jgi:hypothetical protein
MKKKKVMVQEKKNKDTTKEDTFSFTGVKTLADAAT